MIYLPMMIFARVSKPGDNRNVQKRFEHVLKRFEHVLKRRKNVNTWTATF